VLYFYILRLELRIGSRSRRFHGLRLLPNRDSAMIYDSNLAAKDPVLVYLLIAEPGVRYPSEGD